ncbi:MAG: hypothetical protein ACXABY_11445 [Candidatus Thorarchaeota archaeon]|jgi:hypothetical protein
MTSLAATILDILEGSSLTDAIDALFEGKGKIKEKIEVIERLLELFKKKAYRTKTTTTTPAVITTSPKPKRRVKHSMLAKKSGYCSGWRYVKGCQFRTYLHPGDNIYAVPNPKGIRRGKFIRSLWICEKCKLEYEMGGTSPPPTPVKQVAATSPSADDAVDKLDKAAGVVISKIGMGHYTHAQIDKFIKDAEVIQKTHFAKSVAAEEAIKDLKKHLLH